MSWHISNSDFIHSISELPENCTDIIPNPEHSLECITALWLISGCKEKGFKHPPKLDEDQMDHYIYKRLRYFVRKFEFYFSMTSISISFIA